MSGGGKSSAPEYDWNKAKVSFNPVQFQESADYKNALNSLSNAMNTSNANTGKLASTLQNYQNTALAPDYSALSNDQMQTLVNQGKGQLKDSFAENEGRLASHLAGSGLAGSGVAGMDWGGLGKQEDKAMVDVYNNIYNQNLNTTQQDKTNALGSAGTLANLYQAPVNNQTALTGIYGNDQSSKNAWNQWNTQMDQAAQSANIGAYQNWYNQASQDANNQSNAKGGLLGTVGGSILGGPIGAAAGKKLFGG